MKRYPKSLIVNKYKFKQQKIRHFTHQNGINYSVIKINMFTNIIYNKATIGNNTESWYDGRS